MPAAGDQLLGLREKLDFTDAAAPDLDIVALDRDLALTAKRLHLPLHVMHVGKGREIQMLAPDEGRDFRDQRLAGFGIAGAGPRLDHGRALPGPPFRPQAQIDAKHVTVAGALLQDSRESLGDAHEKRLRLDARSERRRGGIEKHDQIDIAGIIQLARAHLAHGEYDETAIVLGGIEVRRRQPSSLGFLPQHEAQRRLHRGDRKVGQRRRHPHHRPDPADVAQRDQQGRFGFHAPKQLHHIGFA